MKYDKIKLYKTEEWYDELGDCVFFSFPNFEEFPCTQAGSPLDGDFDESVWTHFILLDFNHIFNQADTDQSRIS